MLFSDEFRAVKNKLKDKEPELEEVIKRESADGLKPDNFYCKQLETFRCLTDCPKCRCQNKCKQFDALKYI